MGDLAKYSCSRGSSLSSPKRVTSGSRTSGCSPQKRTSSGAPFPRMCATTMPSMRPEGVEAGRSEEHTSELQSRGHLVCRLLLEKKKDPTVNKLEKRAAENFDKEAALFV